MEIGRVATVLSHAVAFAKAYLRLNAPFEILGSPYYYLTAMLMIGGKSHFHQQTQCENARDM